MNRLFSFHLFLCLFSVALTGARMSHAQNYPNKPVKLIVPFPPGAGTDAVARLLAQKLGEQMRQISLHFVPTAILSRQVGVIRGKALVLNLPGQPKSIRETLEGLRDDAGKSVVPGIFAAVPYCLDLIGGPYVETSDAVCKAFRPKSAIRPPASA